MINIPIKAKNTPIPEARKPHTYGLTSVAVLATGTFAVGTDAFIIAGFLPSMAHGLGVAKTAAGQSLTVFAVCYALLAPILASLTSALPRRALLVAALAILAAANVAAALSLTLWELLAARALAATGAAVYTPMAGAVAARLVPLDRRGRALAIVIGGLTLATALGVPLGSLASHWLGWRDALCGVAILSVLAAICIGLTMPPVAGQASIPLTRRLRVLGRPGVTAVLPLTVLGMGASYTVYAYSLPALQTVGLNHIEVVLMLFLYGAGAVLGNLAGGHATDRWGAPKVLNLTYLTMVAAFVMFGYSSETHLRSLLFVGLAAFLWGASSFSQTPPQQHRLIAIAPEEAALLVSLNASAIYLGIALGTLLGGMAIDHIPVTIFATGAMMASFALLYLRLTTRRHPA